MSQCINAGEGARVLRKHECLFDATEIVIANKVIMVGRNDPSELVKKRKKSVSRVSKDIFFQPLIPGVSIYFRSLIPEKEQKRPGKIQFPIHRM